MHANSGCRENTLIENPVSLSPAHANQSFIGNYKIVQSEIFSKTPRTHGLTCVSALKSQVTRPSVTLVTLFIYCFTIHVHSFHKGRIVGLEVHRFVFVVVFGHY